MTDSAERSGLNKAQEVTAQLNEAAENLLYLILNSEEQDATGLHEAARRIGRVADEAQVCMWIDNDSGHID